MLGRRVQAYRNIATEAVGYAWAWEKRGRLQRSYIQERACADIREEVNCVDSRAKEVDCCIGCPEPDPDEDRLALIFVRTLAGGKAEVVVIFEGRGWGYRSKKRGGSAG